MPASRVYAELPGDYVTWFESVNYLTREEDLSTISLCCHQLHAIAAEKRWREVYIDAQDRNRAEAFRTLLRPESAPTRNIRHVVIHAIETYLMIPVLRTLADNLYPHTLRSIR